MSAITTTHKVIFGNSQQMPEITDSTIHLVLTSPPYPMIQMWDQSFAEIDPKIAELIKRFGPNCPNAVVTQIYDLMHENLAYVWKEIYRVLIEGGIVCINIGDATRNINSNFRLFPNHSRIIEHMEKIGFTTLPYLLWKKPTTKPKYKGKGAFLGSGFLPPNAYVTLDCEFILLFRKGKLRRFPPKYPLRYQSALTKKQRDEWFTQIWNVTGSRQTITELERRTAAYPDEIADRLVKMFSIKGDIVLDPFVGSGTTVKVAMQNHRSSIGYETDQNMLQIITKKVSNDYMNVDFKIINR